MNADVVVIGAGAAGLMAAAEAASRGLKTVLLEKNRRPGVKILMSGGTRCNLTQNTDRRGIIKAFGTQGKFLHSALAILGPAELVRLVEDEGVPTKIEETGKIFPASDKATDILRAFMQRLERSGAELMTDVAVTEINRGTDQFVVQAGERSWQGKQIILTTGGLSYPGCGTTGDGYAWAQAFGHTIVPTSPALTPLSTSAAWVKELQGLTIPDMVLKVVVAPRASEATIAAASREKTKQGVLSEQRGSFLFTHFGLSGPVVLDVSRAVTGSPRPMDFDLLCDFLPDINAEQLEQTFLQATANDGKKQLASLLATLLPKRLVEAVLSQANLAGEMKVAELPKTARRKLVEQIKRTIIPLAGYRGYEKAEVTAGGVSREEVDSHTMQSKLVPGLFFAGEILDLDGPIGGYNFQAAFSTGMLAGRSVGR
jgi:predicted Rossmann fold flavoprotein